MTPGEKGITAAKLRELLHYEPSTGVFTWRVRPARNVFPGRVAGELGDNGYTRIQILGRRYQAHRLAWLYVYGEWPKLFIDHINGNKSDNRIANLRDVSRNVNAQNQRKASAKNKSSGLLGVSYHKRSKSYRAGIRLSGYLKYLGAFRTAEEAHQAYLNAKRQLHEGNTL